MFELEKKQNNLFAKYLGFIFSLFVFSSILYIVLRTLNKIPSAWDIINIILLVCWLVVISSFFERYVK